jgi:hypothetical protein
MIKSRWMRWVWPAAHMGEIRNVYKILVREPAGKRSLGRVRHTQEDSKRMDLRDTGWEGVDSDQ